MYRPQHFKVDDEAQLLHMADTIGVASLITAGPAGLLTNEVPLLVEHDARRLWGHLARPNTQLQELAQVDEVLVNFLGPSGYVSPNWYVSTGMVPTWNFVSIQIRGRVVMHDDADEVRDIVRRLSEKHEAQFSSPWTMDKVDEQQLQKMLSVIVGFHIEIDDIRGKYKLSQNRNQADHTGVINGLQSIGQHDLADLMQTVGSE